MYRLFILIVVLFFFMKGKAQDIVAAANGFIRILDSSQRLKALYPFDGKNAFIFTFFTKDDRKGISLNELKPDQKQAALRLMQTCLSNEGVKKAQAIMDLELVLRALEHRGSEDHVRDPGKYYFTIFGLPASNTIWGWRLEGHHISFNFSVNEKKLVAATPGFLGANPAIVPEGPQQGKQVLHDEADRGFALLHSLTKEELAKAIIDTVAPNEIVTFVKRKAMIEHPSGIRFSEMSSKAQQQFLQLINVYIHRYTRLFAEQMLKEIQHAGLNNLWFAWAGFTEPRKGQPHYYRIQGPTIIIEYDNSQNNANHVHTVVRDLQHDFGGDLLLQHYKDSHSNAPASY
ncbi:MAG: DUF3500 domain-containing protein [Flavisolibacter sp.]|nr:DUF3500 domain-containing protein [Flavisolibacter sp.]